LIDDIGGISGYARAYRPMALSLAAVVGAAESTAGGEAGSAVNLKPRCRSSFREWLGRLRRRHLRQVWHHQHTLMAAKSRYRHCFLPRDLDDPKRAGARSVARKLSETPNQTHDFAGRATSAGSTPRNLNNEISKRGLVRTISAM
jgi:hypothetical protein